jgi:hypothetical protein
MMDAFSSLARMRADYMGSVGCRRAELLPPWILLQSVKLDQPVMWKKTIEQSREI